MQTTEGRVGIKVGREMRDGETLIGSVVIVTPATTKEKGRRIGMFLLMSSNAKIF